MMKNQRRSSNKSLDNVVRKKRRKTNNSNDELYTVNLKKGIVTLVCNQKFPKSTKQVVTSDSEDSDPEFETSKLILDRSSQSIESMYIGNSLVNSENGVATLMCNQEFDLENSSFMADAPDSENSNSEAEFPEINGTQGDQMQCYEGTDSKIIVLEKGSLVYTTGVVKLKVLLGCIEICGYDLKRNKDWVEVYSLRGWAQTHFKNINDTLEANAEIRDDLKQYNLSNDDVNDICDNLTKDQSIVCCVPLANLGLRFVEKCSTNVILPKLRGFPADFSNIPGERSLEIRQTWRDLVDYKSMDEKIVLCGGRNVGKSTLLRFMINRFLMYHDEVCVIDLDPGQPEFTMSGCISVVLVDAPIFGPSFTHQKSVICSILHNVDPLRNSEGFDYVLAVQELVSSCKFKKIPTLVNCMGFTKEMGLEIAANVIATIEPKTVVEIKSKKVHNNFAEPLTPECVMKHSTVRFTSVGNTALNYEFVSIPTSHSEEFEGFKPPAKLSREISTIFYFGDIVNGSLSLRMCSSPKYKMGLEYIEVLNSDYQKVVDKKCAIQGNVIALCSQSSKENIYRCHGYGIVMFVTAGEVYLVTPIKDKLRSVTHLIVGVVTMPPTMLHDDIENEDVICEPYSSEDCSSKFSQISKRNYVPRKR